MFKPITQAGVALALAIWAAISETQNILGVFNNLQNILLLLNSGYIR